MQLDQNCCNAFDGSKHKKAKGTKKCVIKREIMFENYRDCLLNNKKVYRSQQRFKSCNQDVYTEEVNKTALSPNDDKTAQTYDRGKTYPYETNAFKVCESEMLNNKRFILWKIIIKRCYANKYKNDQLWWLR